MIENSQKRKRCVMNQKGFSLIEILIAMVILSVGLLSLFMLQSAAVKGNQRSSLLSERVTVATKHLEFLLILPFDDTRLSDDDQVSDDAFDHTPETDGTDNNGDGTIDDDLDDDESNYTVQWNVEDITSDQKSITLSVTGSSLGQDRTVTLSTIRTQ